MSFHIVGDDVYYKGEKVAVMQCDRYPTVRKKACEALETYVDPKDSEEFAGLESEIDDLEREVSSLEDDLQEARDTLEHCEKQRDEARKQSNAYAALLRIEP